MSQEAKILHFPISPMTFIRHAVDRCPAFAGVVARLPEEGDPCRPAAERALAEAFRRIAAPPVVDAEDAATALDHLASREDLIVEMMDRLPSAPERGDLASFWKEVWHREADPAARDAALYLLALVGRLYLAEGMSTPQFIKAF
jgi:hypothetical protein